MKLARMVPWVTGCVVAAMMLTLVPAAQGVEKKPPKKKKAAQKKKPRVRRPRQRPGRFYSDDKINLELDLTPEQQEKFNTAWQKRQDALGKWDAGPKGLKLQELLTEVAAAETPEERRKARALLGQIRRLQAERNLIARRFEPGIAAALPPKAKAIRTGYKLYNKLMAGRLGETVSHQQAEKLRAYCMQAGAGVVKGSVSIGVAERRLRQLAVASLNNGQKKKLGIKVPEKKTDRNKHRRKKNRHKKRPKKEKKD